MTSSIATNSSDSIDQLEKADFLDPTNSRISRQNLKKSFATKDHTWRLPQHQLRFAKTHFNIAETLKHVKAKLGCSSRESFEITRANGKTNQDWSDVTSAKTNQDWSDVTSAKTNQDWSDVTSAKTNQDSIEVTSAKTDQDSVEVASAIINQDSLHLTSAKTAPDSVHVMSVKTDLDSLYVTSVKTDQDSVHVTSAKTDQDSVYMTSAKTNQDSVEVMSPKINQDWSDVTRAKTIELFVSSCLRGKSHGTRIVGFGLILALIVATLVISNIACRALLSEAAKKGQKEQKELATIVLWFAPLCYDSKLISGICYYRLGNFEKAKQLLAEVLNSQTTCSQAWQYHALASFKLGEYHSVIRDYDCLLRKPYDQLAQAYAARGQAKLCLGQYLDALRDLNIALAKAPNKASYLVARGQAYAGSNDVTAALRDINKAIKLDPNSGEGYFARGSIYKSLGKWQLAFADATKAIDVDADYSYAYSLEGEIYLKQNKLDVAHEYFNLALCLDHKNLAAEEGLKHIISQQHGKFLKSYNTTIKSASFSRFQG
jgi:tetratricopeptide (TPR) repeat protein